MDVFRRDQRTHQRAIATREYWNDDLARVQFGQRQRHIARNGGQAQHLKFGTGKRQQDRHGIVLAGIRVDDDLARHANLLNCRVVVKGKFRRRKPPWFGDPLTPRAARARGAAWHAHPFYN